MKSRRYKVIIEPDEPKGFHVWVPSLKGCHSAGITVADAKRNIREAIDLYLESLGARHILKDAGFTVEDYLRLR